MTLVFNQPVKHGAQQFLPGVPVGFEDPDAEAYFVNAGWASVSADEPVFIYDAEAVAIDTQAVFGDGPSKGQLVLGAGE